MTGINTILLIIYFGKIVRSIREHIISTPLHQAHQSTWQDWEKKACGYLRSVSSELTCCHRP